MTTAGEPSRSIANRRAERELLFWTVLQAYKVILVGALIICALIALTRAEVAGHDTLSEILARAVTLFQ